MWYLLIAALLVVFVLGLLYLSFQTAEFPLIIRLVRGRRLYGRLLCLALYGVTSAILWSFWGMMSTLVCLLHLVVLRLFCDLIVLAFRKFTKKQIQSCYAGYAALILCTLCLTAGWFAAHQVRATTYSLETAKQTGSLRIVQITDAHISTTLSGEELAKYVAKINELSPDIVALTGDFVDDDTTAEDLTNACKALGQLQARYGVFFVYGNHDIGYRSEELRGWTDAELRRGLTENGIIILEDESRLIDDRFYVVGRKDRSSMQRGSGRQTPQELLSVLDHDKYLIVLDHQPAEFDAEATAGADLVLCGHTHGGQFFPIQNLVKQMGGNDLCYGHEQRGGTDFIVSSGISNWAFQFRTGCFSEYVVIDIVPAAR